MPSLEPAIDRRPLVVTPKWSLAEAIAMMGKAQSSCLLPGLSILQTTAFLSEARATGILVVEGTQLSGILTQRDVISAIATGENLAKIAVAEVMSQPAITPTLAELPDLFDALLLLRQHQMRHLPLVDDQNQLVGMVTLESIRQALQLDELLKSQPLGAIASKPVIQAPVGSSALALAQLMAEHQASSVVLVSVEPEQNGQPVGIIRAQEIVQLQSLQLELSQLQLQAEMSITAVCFSPSETILTAYWQMQQHQVERAIASDRSRDLLAIVTPTSHLERLDLNLIQDAIAQLEHSIAQFQIAQAQSPAGNGAASNASASFNLAELLEQLECNRLLTAMALHIRESLNLDEILNTAVADVRQFLQTDRVIIYRFNPDMSGIVVVESVAAGWRPALNSNVRDTCFGQHYAQRYKQGRTLVTEDIYTAGLTQCHIDILTLYDVRASLVVPILQGQHLWGLLCAYHCSGPRAWRQFEVDLLKQLATHIAIAIQQSELYQQAQTELNERKRVEEQIKASLKEKETLLQEVHHRVKNNLQIISSLLRLQSDYIKDEKVLTLFTDSQNRIRSMSLIHEKLYRSSDLSKIDFSEYIHDLTESLMNSYTASSHYVDLEIDADNVWLTIDTAIPCGLIINELVSNSLKHAFLGIEQEQNNKIWVEIYCEPERQFNLIIKDNGIGFPLNLDFQNTESLGLQLVCTFTEQLEGKIELFNQSGTTFKITFKELQNLEKN